MQVVEGLLDVLDTMDKWIEEFPPVDQPQRFGNSAFRDWFDKLDEVITLQNTQLKNIF